MLVMPRFASLLSREISFSHWTIEEHYLLVSAKPKLLLEETLTMDQSLSPA